MNEQPQDTEPIEQESRSQGWSWKVLVLAGTFLMLLAISGMVLRNRAVESTAVQTEIPSSALYTGPARVGEAMQDFQLKDTDGKLVKLSDYAGRPVLINAWATWCPPCRAEMPDLNAFYQKYRANGFTVLAVNAGETRDTAVAFTGPLGLTFPILMDPSEALMDALRIQDYPTSILVGRDGKIKLIRVGMFTPDTLNQEVLPLIR